MLPTSHLVVFTVTAFVLIAIPGPSVLFAVLKLAGAAYLVFLGVQAIRHRRSLADAFGAAMERKTVARIVVDGFLVGVTNPKVVIFFAAILPQFADAWFAKSPRRLSMVGGTGGLAMIGIGASLALTGRKS